ncbi:outer membrane protein assembly factor BamA [Mariprofundus sp. EBB-1]|uniref:outer membrane protein assembly factor BamA n=1 Tax=Mariprofundus sp. EBB-1 TaxID=2650971 RepID=UPI000EF1B621|nr:outer membrane protein assembly factor BamA [Mariprofundus sp. EBB-1]RLL52893.1 outer membrane protein assembly factor BamA [Mariprofundus sp. EBB-1]
MTTFIKWLLIHVSLMLSLFCGQITSATAVEAGVNQPVILSIDIEGNRFVERDAVLAKLHTQVGQTLDRRKLSRDVRRLYKEGFFSDIRFVGTRTAQGIQLVCHVKEFPIIANVTIEGNEKHRTKDLKLWMKLKPGHLFNPMNRQYDSNRLLKGYLKDGYYQVHTEFIPTERKDGRIDLLVRVNEGNVTHINRIHIIGNKAFSDAKLRSELASQQSSMLASFGKRDVFDQKRFGTDGQMLQQFYMNNGYLDMKIESQQITIAEDNKTFSLTFSVHEGHSYTVSDINVQGDMVPDEQTMKDLIAFESGDTYSLAEMQSTIAAMTERIGDEGYAFATVTPLLKRNIDDHTVAITFDAEKGKEVYIERIEIIGNEKSNDTVVRRLITQDEGARYSGSQIKVSKEALGRTAFVDDLRVSLPKGSASDKVNMKVDITEKRTGSISGGIGFSQREKVIFTAKLAESNLFGKGYQASLNGTYGKVTQDINASFTNPYLFDSNISTTISGFKKQTDPLATISYQTDSIGGSLGFGAPITHNLSYGIAYRINSTNLTNAPANISLITAAQLGKQTIGELVQSLSWDSRDRLTAATMGHNESITFGFSGLGGQTKFWETSVSSQAYFSIDEEHKYIFNPSFSAAMARPYASSSIPLWRRYSLGGLGSMRGFDSSGISLRDPATGEALGADKQIRASANLFFPLPFMGDMPGIRGVFFADAGTVWGSLSTTVGATTLNISEPFSLSRVRYSAGFGIEWISPVGPVGLVWAFPIKTTTGDIERTFEFALGSSF